MLVFRKILETYWMNDPVNYFRKKLHRSCFTGFKSRLRCLFTFLHETKTRTLFVVRIIVSCFILGIINFLQTSGRLELASTITFLLQTQRLCKRASSRVYNLEQTHVALC